MRPPACIHCQEPALVRYQDGHGLLLWFCMDCWHTRIHRLLGSTLAMLSEAADAYPGHPAVAAARAHHLAGYIAFCLLNNQAPRPLETA